MLTVTAGAVSFSVSHDQPLTAATGGLLANSSTNSGNSLSAILVSGPADGTLTNFGSDGSFTFTPNTAFVGTDSFQFEVTDGIDTSGPVTATINVTDNPAQIQANNLTDLTGDTLLREFASFTDFDNPGGGLAAQINYGDGTSDSGVVTPDGLGAYLLESNHSYSEPGTYTACVTVTDALGVSANTSFNVTVLTQYVSTFTDSNGNETEYVYTGSWQVAQEIDPFGNSTFFTYNGVGELFSKTDQLGRQIDYTYDGAGRLTSETWLNSDGSAQDTLVFTYGSDGQMLSASNDNGTYTFTYDDSGRLVSATEPYGVGLTFGYDANGNRTSVADSFGGVVTSTYDSSDDLVSRSFTDGHNSLSVNLAYASDGNVSTISRYTDLAGTQLVATTQFAYANGEMSSVTNGDANGNVIDGFSYVTGRYGKVTSETSTTDGTINYTYDRSGQLLSDGTNDYSYDSNGNRNMSGFVIGTGNELLSDGTWNYSYDAVGNLVGKVNIATGETWGYTYDDENHMVGAERQASDGTVLMHATYKYDVFGNRIEKEIWTPSDGVSVTRYAIDAWNGNKPVSVAGNENADVWAELDGTNNLTTRYINGDGDNQVFARVGCSGVAWLLADGLGSTRDVVNNAATVLDHIDYGSFGNITFQSNAADGGHILFTGDQYDEETGLCFSRARYLDPLAGRWTTQDPMGLTAGDTNLYRYAANNPTSYVDASGDDWRMIFGGAATIAVAAWVTGANAGEPNEFLGRITPLWGPVQGMGACWTKGDGVGFIKWTLVLAGQGLVATTWINPYVGTVTTIAWVGIAWFTS